MTTMEFRPAVKAKAKLRLAIIGPSGSGKTFTAMSLATGITGGERFAVIDTEHGSASWYADKFTFDTLELDNFDPRNYVQAIRKAEAAGYGVIVIDSLSHAWEGEGGALEMADKAAKKSSSGNSYMAWRDVTPHQNALVEAMLGSRAHIIATMRAKTDYMIETVNGKSVPKRVGMAPVQRPGMEYEFGVVGLLDLDHTLTITKSRIDTIDGQAFPLPGAELGLTMLAWLDNGVEPPEADVLHHSDGTLKPIPADPQAPIQCSVKGCGTPDEDDLAFGQDGNPYCSVHAAKLTENRAYSAVWNDEHLGHEKGDKFGERAKALGFNGSAAILAALGKDPGDSAPGVVLVEVIKGMGEQPYDAILFNLRAIALSSHS